MLTVQHNPRLSLNRGALLAAILVPVSLGGIEARAQDRSIHDRPAVKSPVRNDEAPDTPASNERAEPASKKEVHLVGVNEGVIETGDEIHGPRAYVNLDRPGKEVTLVLTSATPLTWNLSVSEGTNLTKAILGGAKLQAVEGVSDKVQVVGPQVTPLVATYEMDQVQFFRLIGQVAELTGQDVSSFHGTSRPNAPIVINAVHDDPRLSADWPQLATDIPEEVQSLTFTAPYYVVSAASGSHAFYGEFTLDGPVLATLKPLPARVTRVAYDPFKDEFYGIAGSKVVRLDLENQTTEEVEVGLDVPRLSHPREITFDTKRRRVVLGTVGGGGYLYAYSPETEKWSVISKLPGHFSVFAYSEQDDMFYGLLMSRDRRTVTLAKVNSEGALLEAAQLGGPIVPGSLRAAPGTNPRVIPVNGHLVMIGELPRAPGPAPATDWYMYLVDPRTWKIWHTAKGDSSTVDGR